LDEPEELTCRLGSNRSRSRGDGRPGRDGRSRGAGGRARPVTATPRGLAPVGDRAKLRSNAAVAKRRAAGSPAGAGASHAVAAGAVGACTSACRRDRHGGSRGCLGRGCGRGRDDRATWSRAVPVRDGVAETLAYGHGSISGGKQGGQDVVRQVVHGLIVDVVLNLQEAVLCRVRPVDGVVPDVLAGLNRLCVVVEVASRVKVKVDDMISEGGQDVLAVLLADRIGGAHVGWEEAEDGVEGNLVPDHLVRVLRVGQLAGVLVRPRVASNLMSLRMHSLGLGVSLQFIPGRSRVSYFDNGRVDCRGVIDLALAVVVPCDEECGLCSVALHVCQPRFGQVKLVSQTLSLSRRSLV